MAENTDLDQVIKQATADKAVADAKAAAEQARAAKAVADKAESDAAAAQKSAAAPQTSLAGLIPDFTKFTPGTTTASADQPIFGATLGHVALGKAAAQLRREVTSEIETAGATRLLITADASIVDSDATYRQVVDAASWLIADAKALLDGGTETPALHDNLVGTVLTGLAAAVPGILSLFSPTRTVSSAAIGADDLAAAAAVARCFLRPEPAKLTVIHDDVRLLPQNSDVETQFKDLNDTREQLAARKLQSTTSKGDQAKLDAAMQAIDAFVAAVTSVPAGSTRSALMTAFLRELLHGDEAKDTVVLVVKSQAGSSTGLVDDRKLGHDRFFTSGSVNITYFLLHAGAEALVAAGTVTGTATMSGTIGDRIEPDVKVHSDPNADATGGRPG